MPPVTSSRAATPVAMVLIACSEAGIFTYRCPSCSWTILVSLSPSTWVEAPGSPAKGNHEHQAPR